MTPLFRMRLFGYTPQELWIQCGFKFLWFPTRTYGWLDHPSWNSPNLGIFVSHSSHQGSSTYICWYHFYILLSEGVGLDDLSHGTIPSGCGEFLGSLTFHLLKFTFGHWLTSYILSTQLKVQYFLQVVNFWNGESWHALPYIYSFVCV